MTTVLEENPLREGLRTHKTSEPATIVVFGGTGDLAQRKIIPALYDLTARGLMPARRAILGTSRRDVPEEDYRARMREADVEHARSPFKEDLWQSFAAGSPSPIANVLLEPSKMCFILVRRLMSNTPNKCSGILAGMHQASVAPLQNT